MFFVLLSCVACCVAPTEVRCDFLKSSFFVVLSRIYSRWGFERTKPTPTGKKTARMASSKEVKSKNIFVFLVHIPIIYRS